MVLLATAHTGVHGQPSQRPQAGLGKALDTTTWEGFFLVFGQAVFWSLCITILLGFAICVWHQLETNREEAAEEERKTKNERGAKLQ